MTTATKTNAVSLLKADHKKVKELFDAFEEAETTSEKQQFAEEAMKELRVHATIEEEIFYPAIRKALGKEESDLMNEADEEHRVAKTIIEEICDMDAADDHFEAKFTVLAENVRHHIKEEENDMFPDARKTDLNMEALGEKMLTRKEELLADESELEAAEERSRVKPYQKLA